MNVRLVSLSLLAFLAVGCGATALEAAREAVGVTARAGAAADMQVAEAITVAAEEAIAESATLAEFMERMEPWRAVVVALDVLRGALLTAERVLDTWDSGGAEDWLGVAGCLALALDELATTMTAVGLDLPPSLTQAIGMLSSLGHLTCEAP